jgi:type IV pilus assembly protein PilB
MVGEIRDSETADLGVQAALTGHLVFATLHTNNAATCLPRLLDMGVEPFLIASTVRAVIGQRLVRRLCIDCRQPYKPDSEELVKINDIFKANDSKTMAKIHDLEREALEGGVGKANEDRKSKTSTSELVTSETEIKQLWKPAKDGCDICGHTGYKGRVGIYEVLGSSPGIEKLIISSGTSDQIQEEAIKNGMITMQLDGFIKALRGQTSVEEILRVTSEN